MPAYFEQGFTVRKPAWHGLAIVLDEYPGREQAMKLAGHDFKVKEASRVMVQGRTEQREAKGFKALVHGTTGEILNVVRNTYTVVQNDVLWDVVDALVAQPNVKYETAGVLHEGAQLWVSAYLDEPIQIKGDDSISLPYISASTTHDGSGSLQARSHMERIICANTFEMAKGESAKLGTAFTFRHTKNVHARIEDAKAIIRGTRNAMASYVELANDLAEMRVSPQQHALFIEQLVPMPLVAPGLIVSERSVSNIQAARLKIEQLFDGPTIPEAHRSTGYGLFLAATEFLDHLRPYRNQATYLGRTLLRSEPAKDNLTKLIREVVLA